MAQVRTYLTIPYGREADASVRSVDSARMRVDAKRGDSLLASLLMADAEAVDLANGILKLAADRAAPAPPASGPTAGRALVFEDTFSGNAVDTTKWGMYNSKGHAGHGLRHPSAFTVENGLLVITAKMVDGATALRLCPTSESAAFKDTIRNGAIVSGGMSRKVTQGFGYYEARVRTEIDPAGVMSGLALTYAASGNGTRDGENDFYETGRAAGVRTPFRTFIHYPDPVTGANRQFAYEHRLDATQWHVMGMDWRADRCDVYRDGVKVWSCPDVSKIPRTLHKFCLQLDAMVAGVPLTQPVRHFVDYVRIWD